MGGHNASGSVCGKLFCLNLAEAEMKKNVREMCSLLQLGIAQRNLEESEET